MTVAHSQFQCHGNAYNCAAVPIFANISPSHSHPSLPPSNTPNSNTPQTPTRGSLELTFTYRLPTRYEYHQLARVFSTHSVATQIQNDLKIRTENTVANHPKVTSYSEFTLCIRVVSESDKNLTQNPLEFNCEKMILYQIEYHPNKQLDKADAAQMYVSGTKLQIFYCLGSHDVFLSQNLFMIRNKKM